MKEGDSIKIAVDKNKPQSSRIESHNNKRFLSESYVFIVLAVVFFLLGALIESS